MKTLFLLAGIIAFLFSGFSYAQQSEKPNDMIEDEGDQPVDVTGKAHYQPGFRGYMAGKEHYIQGNPNYMAGKEYYLPQPSSSTLRALAEQVSADAISAKVEEGPTMVWQITIEEGKEEERGQYQIPAFRGKRLAKPPHGEWQLPVFKEEKMPRKGKGGGTGVLVGVEGGAVDSKTGKFYPDATGSGGVIDPVTGRFFPAGP